MKKFEDLHIDFKAAQKVLDEGFSNLKMEFDSEVKGRGDSIVDELHNQSADFSLYYCLQEALTHTERGLKEKPSRELSLVKTHLQIAISFANMI